MPDTTVADQFADLGKALGGITLTKVLSVIVLVIACLIVIRIIMSVVNRVLERGRIEKSLHTFIRTGTKILLYFLAVLIVADSIGINVSSLVAVLSVTGLAVSLAVQSTLSNLAGGIQILTTQPFKVGDYADVGGTGGTVREIGLVHTKLMTPDNKLIYIPNSDVAAAKITNFSAEERRRVDLVFSVSYDAAPSAVIETLKALVESHPKVLRDPAPFIRLSEYGDNQISYTVRAWAENADYWDVYFDLMGSAKAALDAKGIEMSYPHMNVHIVEK